MKIKLLIKSELPKDLVHDCYTEATRLFGHENFEITSLDEYAWQQTPVSSLILNEPLTGPWHMNFSVEEVVALLDADIQDSIDEEQRTFTLTEVQEIDRNARAFGWEIGRGHPITEQVGQISFVNPFLNPMWRTAAGLKEDE